MQCTLVTVEKGLVRDVEFFDDPGDAVLALAQHAKSMNLGHEDAAVYGPDGLIASADQLLNWRANSVAMAPKAKQSCPTGVIQ